MTTRRPVFMLRTATRTFVPRLSAVTWPRASSTPSDFGTRSARVVILLVGVTGWVAAIRTPALYEALKQAGHQTKIVATQAALYFFDPTMLDPADPARPARNPAVVVLGEEEWPGRFAGRRYQRGDPGFDIGRRPWCAGFSLPPQGPEQPGQLA